MRCEDKAQARWQAGAPKKRSRPAHRQRPDVRPRGRPDTGPRSRKRFVPRDLGAVISKYIGETEKNLRGVFHAARKSRVVLFLDEADALFGKRGEVKDSHDRFANIEINYLLKRIEEYVGLAILASGNRTKIDSAFSRRFHFLISIRPRRKARPPGKNS